MKTTLTTAIFLLLVQAAPSRAQTPKPAKELEIDNRASVRFTQVSGPGRGASFYRNGVYGVDEPDIFYRKALPLGWRVAGESKLRFTNDQLVDMKGFSVETLTLDIQRGSGTLTLGDYFASLSQYSMSQMLKGAAFQRNFKDEENYVRVAAGSFDSQWEYLYKDEPNESMNRYGGGFRGQKTGESYRMGLNWGVVNDHKEDPMRRRTQEDAYYQNIGAFDWEYRLAGMTFDGEHAAAVTVKSPLDEERTQHHGHANRLRGQGNVFGARLMAGFENVSSGFSPLAGSATQDRRRYTAQLTRRLSPVWQASGKFSLSHDNLEGAQLRTRTTLTTWDAGLTRTRLFGRRDNEVSTTWRRSQTDTRNMSRDRTVDRFQLSVADQLTKATRARVMFEPTLDQDFVRGNYVQNFLWEMRLSDRRRLPRSWTMNSTLSGRRRETENLNTLGHDYQHGAAGRVDFSRPGGLQTGLDLDYSNVDLWVGNDARTARAKAFLGFQPKWLPGSAVDLEWSVAHYAYATVGQDYTEHLFKIGFNWRI